MPRALILASSSDTRRALLQNAGLNVTAIAPRVDEDAIRDALILDGAHPRDIADALAEAKARKLADKNPDDLVLGCDQVLALDGHIFSKPETADIARAQLHQLRSKTHLLLSAMVLYDAGAPIWRHVAQARLTMRPLSDAFVDGYVARNWRSISGAVGAYKLEEEGAQLFSEIDGDYFTILGLPLLPLLNYFAQRGFITT